ncbi:PHA/PHB synthase family protein [Rhodocyclus gracilis]|uniref:Alpha/beta fold hydrolase n=1 Tax=Rhodocyclus tenuis TaxID=1066 RepID=A0A6L5JUE5_RHOTE|nr:alpha/beta fold hydrolase [Rhodocyclus gracilis]MQY50967.1 alpha/beta fold hydrolase [Rhodocyclus gracilis]
MDTRESLPAHHPAASGRGAADAIAGLSPEHANGVERALLAAEQRLDPFGVTTSVLNACAAWLAHPMELSRALAGWSDEYVALQQRLVRRAWGLPEEAADVGANRAVTRRNVDDPRFSDPVWSESPSWSILKDNYLLFTRRLQDMLFETPGLSEKSRRRAAFWVREWLNAMAPTNFFWSNPLAWQKFVDSHGESLLRGAALWADDLKAGTVRMVDEHAFTVGVDLALTPGRVVLRNRLLELIHYAPTTPTVFATPIVIVTPWINKYYILDLTPQKSLVRYLVAQGFSVFITSWKNPDAAMADVRFDDYLREGVDQAVTEALRISRAKQVHLVGYCIGGTLCATYMAWAKRQYAPDRMPVAHWTLLSTLTDFARPGDIDVFIDESSIAALEEMMARQGYLDGSQMSSSFRLLRSNSLIWHYVTHSYLYGEAPPAFDVLFWNVDCTRMPQAMHSFYLREMYLNNNLKKRDALTIAGQPIDLDRIDAPLYAVTAEDDHIAPWQQCYRIRKFINVAAPMRFVLSSSGHIFGIVNPVVNPPKRHFRVGVAARNDHVEHWLAHAVEHPGSWWEDWRDWLAPQCGERVAVTDDQAAPAAAAAADPSDAAPGRYVLER